MPEATGSVIKELISAADATVVDKLSHTELISAVDIVRRLSKEQEMPGFCSKLLNIAMQETGSLKGLFFIVDHRNNSIDQTASALTEHVEETGFSESVVNYAAQKQKMIILGDVLASLFFCHDKYIKNHQANSILCIPLVQNSKTEAIVYLENFQTEKISTKSQLSLLCFVISQATPFFRHIHKCHMTAESEKKYQRLYQQELENAQALSKHIVTPKIAHDIRASINAILGYLEIMKETMNDGQPLDAEKLSGDVDQIISRSWYLLNLINHGAALNSLGNRPCNHLQKEIFFDANHPAIKDNPAQFSKQEKTSKSREIIKVKLDYDMASHSGLLEALKKAEKQCFSIMKAMIIRDVDAFGADIVRIGNTYKSSAIAKWGLALKEHTANFNKNEMELMMQWFHEIVLNVESRQPGQTDIKIIPLTGISC
jgi:hypothetical protein